MITTTLIPLLFTVITFFLFLMLTLSHTSRASIECASARKTASSLVIVVHESHSRVHVHTFECVLIEHLHLRVDYDMCSMLIACKYLYIAHENNASARSSLSTCTKVVLYNYTDVVTSFMWLGCRSCDSVDCTHLHCRVLLCHAKNRGNKLQL